MYSRKRKFEWYRKAAFQANQVRRKYNGPGLGSFGAMASALPIIGSAFSRPKKMVSAGRGITNQYDRALIYKKRRMPRRKRKIWKRFKRKVYAVSEKSLGTKTVLFNTRVEDAFFTEIGNLTRQSCFNVALYPFYSNSKDYLRDVYKIASNDTQVDAVGKILFQSAVLDLTVCNTSVANAESGNPIPAIEVDLYEIIASTNFEDLTGGSSGDLLECFDTSEAQVPVINSTVPNDSLNQYQRGCTPFDIPAALGKFRLKILKKTKYFLAPGQTFTYQLRDPKRHVYNKQNVTMQCANLPRMTRWVYFVYKPTPCTRTYDDTNYDIVRLSVGVSRKYMYKVNEVDGDQDAYNIV